MDFRKKVNARVKSYRSVTYGNKLVEMFKREC